MKNSICFFSIVSKKLVAGYLTVFFLVIQLPSKAQGVVVWEDHFFGSTLNPSYWSYDIGNGCNINLCGWGNNELQSYTDSLKNVRVENGNLIIETRREPSGGMLFTSGRIKTFGKVHFKYGTLEARIKIPNLKSGLWPSFWTLGVLGLWPSNGEINVMEFGGASSYPDSVNHWLTAATHWEFQDRQADYAQTYKSPIAFNDDYHIYKLVWDSTFIKMYIDDIQYYAISIGGGALADLEEFHKFHHILLNVAVGGNFTGITNVPGITAPMPAQMLVDYVRLTQRPGDSIWFATSIPIKLLDFSLSTSENKSVLITWKTTNEENSDYYILERSSDGASFNKVGIVKSKGSLVENNYSFTDNTPAEGQNYYRLVQVDKSGKKMIYEIKAVTLSKFNLTSATIFPNPSKGNEANILLNEPVEKILKVQVLDLLGRVVFNVKKRPNANVLQLKFNNKLEPGLYLVKINGIISDKLVIQ